MITEKDLQEAIAECEGQRNPNANTCIKLAAFYTIKRELFGSPEQLTGYSGDSEYKYPEIVQSYDSGTDFSNAISGMEYKDVMALIDELMTTLQIVNPRLYASVMRKIGER